jgi:hypothetical protein
VAAASSGRAPRRQIDDDGGGGAPTGGTGQGGGGTQARKQRGAILWARGRGDRVVPGSDVERQRGAGGMPLDSGESRSGTRWTATPDGPARRAHGWVGSGPEHELGRAEEAKAHGVREAPADLGLMGHKDMWAENDERKKESFYFQNLFSGKNNLEITR